MKNDMLTRRITTGIVATVGLFAGADSYTHIYGLARDWHQNIASAALAPLTADGLVLASTAAMFAATRHGRDIPFRARAWFWTGTIATLAGNGASGWPHGTGAALLALWPVLAYIGCMEVLTWMLQHLRAQPRPHLQVHLVPPAPAPETAVASASPDALEVPDVLEDELRVRRQRKARTPLHVLLADAEAKFPVAVTGKIPVLRDIQATMRVGQLKAQQVQAHLRELVPDMIQALRWRLLRAGQRNPGWERSQPGFLCACLDSASDELASLVEIELTLADTADEGLPFTCREPVDRPGDSVLGVSDQDDTVTILAYLDAVPAVA